MRVDGCFTAVRAGEPTDVKIILTGEIVHGVPRSGDVLVVTRHGKTMPARCVGVTMSNPIRLIVSGIEKFDAVDGEWVSAADQSTVPISRR
jgi:hypothetical protein